MILLDLIFFIVGANIAVTTLYLLVLTLAAYFFKPIRPAEGRPATLTVVIPAHDESLSIARTVKSIRQAQPDEDRCRIVVIADNCTDDTADKARRAGALVTERRDDLNRGKGQALDWFFKTRTEMYEDLDAVAVVDADTLIHPRFLEEAGTALAREDIQAVQGFYGVSNPRENWRTALSAAALFVFHHIRPAGRNRISGTAGLKGNGMAFKTPLIRKWGWPAFSIVEDIEFSLMLLLEGIRVHYLPGAEVYGEMASRSDAASTQRSRWEGGRIQLLKTYLLPLVTAFIRQRRILFLDAAMELLTPPLSLLVAGQVLLFALSFVWHPGTALIWGSCLYVTVIYVFSGLILKRAPFFVWRALFCAPFFILWKIPVYFNLIVKKQTGRWVRTRREDEPEKDSQEP